MSQEPILIVYCNYIILNMNIIFLLYYINEDICWEDLLRFEPFESPWVYFQLGPYREVVKKTVFLRSG